MRERESCRNARHERVAEAECEREPALDGHRPRRAYGEGGTDSRDQQQRKAEENRRRHRARTPCADTAKAASKDVSRT